MMTRRILYEIWNESTREIDDERADELMIKPWYTLMLDALPELFWPLVVFSVGFLGGCTILGAIG